MPTHWIAWVMLWHPHPDKPGQWQIVWERFCPLDDGVPQKFDSWEDATICIRGLIEQVGYEDGIALREGEHPRRTSCR